MKKIKIIIMLIIMFSASSSSVFAKSIDKGDNEKEVVLNAANLAICDTYDICDTQQIKLSKEKVYDMFMNSYGFIYEFELKNDQLIHGYIITNQTELGIEVEEIHLEQSSPYIYKDYKNIYNGYNQYYEVKNDILLDSTNGAYYDYEYLLNQYGLNSNEVSLIMGAAKDPIFVTVYYTTGDEVLYSYSTTSSINVTDFQYPTMSQTDVANESAYSSDKNNCSTVSGLSLIVFYEYYYPDSSSLTDVIYEPGDKYYTSTFFFNDRQPEAYNQKDNFIDIYEYLYVQMDTSNWGPLSIYPGTSHPNFLSAMRDYYDTVGYDVVIDVMIGNPSYTAYYNNSFDATNTWVDYKDSINNNTPVLMQLGGIAEPAYAYLNEIIIEEDVDSRPGPYGSVIWIDEVYYEYKVSMLAMHTVVGYGYVEYSYYNTGLVRRDKFAKVSNNAGSFVYIQSSSNSVSQAYSFSIEPKT